MIKLFLFAVISLDMIHQVIPTNAEDDIITFPNDDDVNIHERFKTELKKLNGRKKTSSSTMQPILNPNDMETNEAISAVSLPNENVPLSSSTLRTIDLVTDGLDEETDEDGDRFILYAPIKCGMGQIRVKDTCRNSV